MTILIRIMVTMVFGLSLGFAIVIMATLSRVDDVYAQERSQLRWTVLQLSKGNLSQGTPSLTLDADGGVHVFWASIATDDTSGAIFYAHRTGADWVSKDIIAETAQNPTAALGSHNTLHLVWDCDHIKGLRYSFAPLSAAISPKGWARPITLADGLNYHPQLLYDHRGILHVVSASPGDRPALYYRRSLDGGKNWQLSAVFEVARPSSIVTYPRMSLARDGTLHLVWSLTPVPELYGGLGIYYVQSKDAGETWSEPIRLDEPDPDALGQGAWQASLCVVDNDEVHVVWDAHSRSGSRQHRWSRDGGVTWSERTEIWEGFISQTGPNPMIVDSAESLYLFSAGTFDWSRRQGVYFSRWTGSGWTQPELVDDSSDEPHWIHVALAEGNRLHVVWEAREQRPRGVWYASASTSAPRILPTKSTSNGYPVIAPVSTATVSPNPTELYTTSVVEMAAGKSRRSMMFIDRRDFLAVGILPVALLIGIVAILQSIRAR